ncbi:CxC ATPase DNA modification system associated small protein [Vibrio cyclitrophicus]
MNLQELKSMLQEADRETDVAHKDYSKRSAVHKTALQIMQFEKELHYGDASTGHHLKKIKEIIEFNSDDIVNETY